MYLRRTMFTSAVLAAVVMWPVASEASAVPGSPRTAAAMAAYAANAPETPADDDSPYHRGYADGYAGGEAYARNYCSWGVAPVGEGAYWKGYWDGWDPGYRAGYDKNCLTPSP